MPVDYSGFVIAIIVWIGGTVLAYRRIRARLRGHPDQLAAIVGTLLLTVCASAVLAAGGLFIAWFYDWVKVGGW